MNLEILTRPFPKDQIKQREGNFGKMLDYVETPSVIARLNEAFEGHWSFRVLSHQILEQEVIVLGELSADGEVKQQFGSKQIAKHSKTKEPLSLGDDLKGATSDALKKCATEFGVALELYCDRASDRNGQVKLSPVDRLKKAKGSLEREFGKAGRDAFKGILRDFAATEIEGLEPKHVTSALRKSEQAYRKLKAA